MTALISEKMKNISQGNGRPDNGWITIRNPSEPIVEAGLERKSQAYLK